jgi:hypothetical protein
VQLKQILRLEELLELPEPFAILALPASGTTWMCRALYEAGRPVHHEHYQHGRFRKCDRNLMSFKFSDKDLEKRTFKHGIHAPKAGPFTDFRGLIYHVRNPLNQVYSFAAMNDGRTQEQLSNLVGHSLQRDPLGAAMNLAINFHLRAKSWADAWYRVEDMRWSLPPIQKHNRDRKPSWEELYRVSKLLATELRLQATELGYE